MGIAIECTDETTPYPRPIVVVFTCDGPIGLFPSARAVFAMEFTAAHSAAMQAGWRTVHDRGNVQGLFQGAYFLWRSASNRSRWLTLVGDYPWL